MSTKRVQVKKFIANKLGVPMVFIANIIRETAKAVYLQGRGTAEDHISCMKCGRELTHPTSRLVGIGPVCGQHYWGIDITKQDEDYLKTLVHDIAIDGWFPRSQVVSMNDTDEVFEIKTASATTETRKPITASIKDDGSVGIYFGYDPDLLEKVKGLPRRWFVGNEDPKHWEAPLDAVTVKTLNSWSEVELHTSLKLWLTDNTDTVAQAKVATPAPKPRKIATRSGTSAITVSFPYDAVLVKKVGEVSGRKWNKTSKCWTIPLSLPNIEWLERNGFEIVNELTEWADKLRNPMTVDTVKGLNGTLRSFQLEGVNFILSRGGRALIADEMGLGKTIQALAWIHEAKAKPALLVVPASLKLNWEKEARKWLPGVSVSILSGRKPNAKALASDLVIINYDILSSWQEMLKVRQFKAVVFDEAHYLKNYETQRSQAADNICEKIDNLLCLTGTPITNRPVELFSIARLIDSAVFPKFFDYGKRFCDGKHNGYGWDFNGASNTDELNRILTQTFMIRRKKSEVLTELPPKVRTVLPLEYDVDIYTAAWNASKAWEQEPWIDKETGEYKGLKADNPAAAMVEFEKVRRGAVEAKLKSSIDWIRDFLDTNGKLVVFAIHQTVINALMDEFGDRAVKIDGSVPNTKRQDAVDAFQTDDSIRLFVGNIKAAGVGHTLTAASDVAFLELGWTPGEIVQAEDRVHRIGQNDSVNIYYLVAAGTIEEKIAEMIDAKAQVLASVLDGERIDSSNLITGMLAEFRGETTPSRSPLYGSGQCSCGSEAIYKYYGTDLCDKCYESLFDSVVDALTKA